MLWAQAKGFYARILNMDGTSSRGGGERAQRTATPNRPWTRSWDLRKSQRMCEHSILGGGKGWETGATKNKLTVDAI